MLDSGKHYDQNQIIRLKLRFTYLTGIAVIAAAMLFYSCTNDLDQVWVQEDTEQKPTAITRNVKILYSDSGKVITVVTAPLRYDYTGEPSYSEMPEGIKAEFFNENRKSTTTLIAGYALIRSKEDIFYVKKDVVVLNQAGETLETQSLTWDNKRKMLFTYDNVKITKKDQVLYGQGIVANDNFSSYTILLPFGTLPINENN